MIIVRYLTRQILAITAALTFILLIVVMLGRLLNYLAAASQGELDPAVLVLLMNRLMPAVASMSPSTSRCGLVPNRRSARNAKRSCRP